MSSLLARIVDVAGGLDIFHANAGAYVGGKVDEGDPDEWDRVLQLNTIKPILEYSVQSALRGKCVSATPSFS